MGLDTVYIPVKQEDIDYFVADVANSPDLADERVRLLTKSNEDHTFIKENLYPRIINHLDTEPFDSHFGFAATAILGYLHPYYYERGMSLMDVAYNNKSQSKQLCALFDDFSACFPSLKHAGDSGGLNYRSGIYIRAENIQTLLDLLTDDAHQDELSLENDCAFLTALRYAARHDTGLVESFDLYVPMANEYHSVAYNLRAQFLDNLSDETTQSDCEYTTLTIGIPVPSSSVIDENKFGQLIYEWIGEENKLPALNNASATDHREVPGSISLTLMFTDATPLVFIRSETNIFIPNTNAYEESLKESLAAYLERNNLNTRFFVSTQEASQVPDDIASVRNCHLRYLSKPSFMLSNHKWSFLFDEIKVDMTLTLKGEMKVYLNEQLLDAYKVSLTKSQNTVFFANGNWYTIRITNKKPATAELDVEIYKSTFLQGKFRFTEVSKFYPSFTRGLLITGEFVTLALAILFFAMPKPFLLIGVLISLSLMFKYNKRHHYVLAAIEPSNDTPE